MSFSKRFPYFSVRRCVLALLGSAILAAVAAGRWTLQEAIGKMQCADTRNYTPDPARPYEFLYEAYITMTNTCFGPLKPILDGLYVRRRK